MPFVPAPNIVQVEFLATKDGQQIENRIMVNVGHAPTLADFTALQGPLQTWIANTYAPLLPSDITVTGLRFTDMSQQNGPQLQVALAIVGAVAPPSAPNEVTYCVSLRTGNAGRSARGRWYWLGLALANIPTQNRVGAGFRTNSTAAIQTLIQTIANLGYFFTIVSYINNGVPRVGGPVYFFVLTATTTDDIVDSQRRRRPGIGS